MGMDVGATYTAVGTGVAVGIVDTDGANVGSCVKHTVVGVQ